MSDENNLLQPPEVSIFVGMETPYIELPDGRKTGTHQPDALFWYSAYGLKPAYQIMNLNLYFKNKRGNPVHHVTELVAKGFFRDLSTKAEGGDDFWREELDGQCHRFGKNLEGLLQTKEMELSYRYPPQSESPKLVVINLNNCSQAIQLTDSYVFQAVQIFHPAEYLTLNEVDDAVLKYCSYFCGIPFCRLIYEHRPEESEIRANFELEDFSQMGPIAIEKSALEEIFGTEEVSRFGDQIEYGFIEGDHVFVKLKDGRELPIGKPNLKVIESDSSKD
jgi:hypothetical protein